MLQNPWFEQQQNNECFLGVKVYIAAYVKPQRIAKIVDKSAGHSLYHLG